MSFNVIPSNKFKREAKRLIKKFPSLKHELADLSTTLDNEPQTGTPLGNNTIFTWVSKWTNLVSIVINLD